ncbi:hypothetical protein EV426DRAFT_629342 [Tirmania nivea]|nr:hypothetical protein EV426DRAFT_629342 [Tirmania nivea]
MSRSRPSSAPAGCTNFSTPVKRKTACVPLPQDVPYQSTSSGNPKRQRTTTTVKHLLRSELAKCRHTSATFAEDFLIGERTITREQSLGILRSITEKSMVPGISHDSSERFTCVPPGYTNVIFPPWFCRFANSIAANDYSLANERTSSCSDAIWVPCSRSLPGERNNRARPDFVLALDENPSTGGWRTVLVVGEHHSTGSSVDISFLKLAAYAEQVFIAQPFRNFVFGILTSNADTFITFWRFDRAGAVGSLNMNYGSCSTHGPDGGLTTVARCLHTLARMSASAIGFHTSSITCKELYPTDARCNISTSVSSCPGVADNVQVCRLDNVIFVASGLVSRGTRVWEGTVDSGKVVAIKYSWRSASRVSEGDLYKLAVERGVFGLPQLIAYDSYEDITYGVRRGHIPISLTAANDSIDYSDHMHTHNRILTRLIFGTTGVPIANQMLPPLAVARALLAGLIGHASLYFDAKVLHRDLSPYNIISCSTPVIVPDRANNMICVPGTELYGSIIDLDYALDISTHGLSGLADRTGTYPFIAIQILRGHEGHRYRHDLESMFYVLLWVACYHISEADEASKRENDKQVDGNPTPEPKSPWIRSDPLAIWGDAEPDVVAAHKHTNVIDSTFNFRQLLQHFHPRFEPFCYAAHRLRLALWGQEGGAGGCKLVVEEIPKAPGEQDAREGMENVGETQRRRKGKRVYKDLENLQYERFIKKDEVRPDVNDLQGYLQFRDILRDLVSELEDERDDWEEKEQDKGGERRNREGEEGHEKLGSEKAGKESIG